MHIYIQIPEIKERLPMDNTFFEGLNFISPAVAISQSSDRPKYLISLAQKLKVAIDITRLDLEWNNILHEFTEPQKKSLMQMNVECFWKAIAGTRDIEDNLAFPNCVLLACTVMSFPHSNSDAERIFSIVTDVKTKKRNHLGDLTLNAIALTRSSFLNSNTYFFR